MGPKADEPSTIRTSQRAFESEELALLHAWKETRRRLRKGYRLVGRSRVLDTSTAPGWILVEELFETDSDAFLDTLLRFDEEARLAKFAARWLADPRPWARRQLLAYVDDGCDRWGTARSSCASSRAPRPPGTTSSWALHRGACLEPVGQDRRRDASLRAGGREGGAPQAGRRPAPPAGGEVARPQARRRGGPRRAAARQGGRAVLPRRPADGGQGGVGGRTESGRIALPRRARRQGHRRRRQGSGGLEGDRHGRQVHLHLGAREVVEADRQLEDLPQPGADDHLHLDADDRRQRAALPPRTGQPALHRPEHRREDRHGGPARHHRPGSGRRAEGEDARGVGREAGHLALQGVRAAGRERDPLSFASSSPATRSTWSTSTARRRSFRGTTATSS